MNELNPQQEELSQKKVSLEILLQRQVRFLSDNQSCDVIAISDLLETGLRISTNAWAILD
jgi:hypothetical protein